MSVLIQQVQICAPGSPLHGHTEVAIDQGRFVDATGFQATTTIDGKGQWLFPGLIDLRAEMREPGLEHKGTIASETRAAVAGGVTTVVATPNTDPVVDSPADVRLVLERAGAQGHCRVLPTAMLTQGGAGTHLSEMAALMDAGCIALSQGNRPFVSQKIQYNALKYAASLGITVFLDAESPDFSGGCAHAGHVGTGLGLPLNSPLSETLGLAADLELVEATGVRAHFSRLTTARSVERIRSAKAQGLPVTCDVTLSHLLYCEDNLVDLDPVFHLQRPLRTRGDRDALRAAVIDGTIDAIITDHSPHEPGAKLAPFPETEAGMSLLDVTLPLLWSLAQDSGMPIEALIRAMSTHPAAFVGEAASGSITHGGIADCVLFDPTQSFEVTTARLKSAGHNSPVLGRTLTGLVTQVWVAGRPALT